MTASAFKALVQDLISNGVDIGITVYENAHHGFDRLDFPAKEKKGYATGYFHFRMRSNGALLTNFFDIPIVTPFRQKVALG